MTLQESLLRRFAGGHPTEAAAILGEESADGIAAVLDRLSEETAAIMLGRTASPVAAGALLRPSSRRNSCSCSSISETITISSSTTARIPSAGSNSPRAGRAAAAQIRIVSTIDRIFSAPV